MGVLKRRGKIPLRNKIIIALIILLLIAVVSIFIIYSVNEEARDWININILRKEVTEEDVATIEIDGDKTQYIYAYDRYITILSNGKLEAYNSYGNKAYELEITISNPIFGENGRRIYRKSNYRKRWNNISNNKRNKL